MNRIWWSIMELFGRYPRGRQHWPAEIKPDCRVAWDWAKATVGGQIGRIRDEYEGNTYTVKAERIIDGHFVWRHPMIPQGWVEGTTTQVADRGLHYHIGHHPADPRRVSLSVLHHEYCHGLLYPKGIRGHDARLDAHVDGWRHSREVMGVTATPGAWVPRMPDYPRSIDVEYLDGDRMVTIHADGFIPFEGVMA